MMAFSEDDIALAAEYALGTLDADERAEAEAKMSIDKDFAAMGEAWQPKLGVLTQMGGSVEPRPEVWNKIKSAISLSEAQAALVLPEAARRVAWGALEPPAVADTSNVVRLSAQAQRWRNVATFATAIAAALIAVIAVGVYQPDLLPGAIRPKPRTQVVEVKTPSAPTPRSAQYVAVLQKEGGSPAFILTVDAATKNFTVRKVGAAAEPGKSFELWLISDKLQRPRSLGVIGGNDFTTRPGGLASYDADTINAATYAVTTEQAGGSPDRNPHSAPGFA